MESKALALAQQQTTIIHYEPS